MLFINKKFLISTKEMIDELIKNGNKKKKLFYHLIFIFRHCVLYSNNITKYYISVNIYVIILCFYIHNMQIYFVFESQFTIVYNVLIY
jgi:hypothetical protein